MDRIGRLFTETAPRIRGYLLRSGATPTEAEESVSHAFEVLLESTRRGEEPHSNPTGYLFTVAKRHLYAQWNSHERVAGPEEDLAEHDSLISEDAGAEAIVADLEAQLATTAFGRLPEEDQHLLWSALAERVPQRELAERVGVSPAALRKRVSRARLQYKENYLRAFAADQTAPECEAELELLAKEALGSASPVERRALRKHLRACEPCARLLRSTREEAGQLRRLTALIPLVGGAIAAGSIPLPKGAERLAMLSKGSATVGGGLCVTAATLALLGLLVPEPRVVQEEDPASPTATARPGAEDVPEQSDDEPEPELEPEPGSVPPISAPSRGDGPHFDVAPARASLPMPAPGHAAEWLVEVRNDSPIASVLLEIELHGEQTESTESPRLSLTTDDEVLISGLPLRSTEDARTIRIELPANGSEELHARLDRDPDDTDQALSGGLEVRIVGEEPTDLDDRLALVDDGYLTGVAAAGIAGAGGLAAGSLGSAAVSLLARPRFGLS